MHPHSSRNLPRNLATVDGGLRLIAHARTRGVAERWLLDFACAHTRFLLDEALLLGWQWLQRSGLETILSSGDAAWMKDPKPGTLEEWAARGCVVDPDAIPLLLPGEGGQSREYHLLYDVVTVDDHASDTIGNPELEPTLPDVHDHQNFSTVLGEREVTMCAHLWRWKVRLGWAARADETPAWIELDPATDSPGRQDGSLMLINSHLDDIDIMTLLLRYLAELASARAMSPFLTSGGQVGDPVPATPLERGLAVEIVQRRIRVGHTYANTDTHRYLVEGPGAELTVIRWPLVYTMAQLMEDLLLGRTGESPDVDPGVEPEDTGEVDEGEAEELDDSHPAPEEDMWDRVDDLMWEVPVDQEDAAVCWLRDFVVARPRFSVGQAVALGWQLWQRWGEDLAFDLPLRAGVLDIELRTEEEWESRGRGARAGAQPLWAPGTGDTLVCFLVSGDVEIMDLSVALDADSRTEVVGRNLPYHPPAEDAPELQSLRGLVSDYELSLLGNVARHGLVLRKAESDDLSTWFDDDGREHVPVQVTSDYSAMRASLIRLVRMLTQDRLTVEEDELALLIVAQRLGLAEKPLSDEVADFFLAGVAPEGVSWGKVYRAVADLEKVLRGTP